MTIERKLLGTSPSGGSTDVAEVFSVDVYTGIGSPIQIYSGIDISGEGGLVITKGRDIQEGMNWTDTVRGAPNRLRSHVNNSSAALTTGLTAFNSTGHVYGSNSEVNSSGNKYVAWTFRKKKKFFDVLTYTGNNEVAQTVSHDLGVVPAMIIIKSATDAGHWYVWHKDLTSASYILKLNSTGAQYTDSNYELGINATDTTIYIDTGSEINYSGTYVAYLFADNSSEDADDQMIKCGSVTTGNVNTNVAVNLGWQPQWILMKNTSSASQWFIADTMRGWVDEPVTNQARSLLANSINVENNGNFVKPTSTGFTVVSDNLGSAQDWIYCAIRTPMMVEPEAGTDIYQTNHWDNATPYTINTGFTTDLLIYTRNVETSGASHRFVDRLRGETKRIASESLNAESAWTHSKLDVNNGYTGALAATGGNKNLTHAFSRAKGCIDIVGYTGNSSSSQDIGHSLGVVPEFIINVSRSTGYFYMYHASLGYDYYFAMNDQAAGLRDPNDFWGVHTDTLFKVLDIPNSNNVNYVNYLFATLAGITKCGGYTGNGSSQTIDCGFSAGARFVLARCTSIGSNEGVNSTNTYVWDSVRGIVSGNESYYILNRSNADVSSTDSIDPVNSGFIVNQNSTTDINVSGRSYVFLAIA